MGFPLTERHKNLEQRVDNLAETYLQHPPFGGSVKHGVVRDVVMVSEGSSGCGEKGTYLEVCPLPPINFAGSAAGHLGFDSDTISPLDGIDATTGRVRVYVLNAPPSVWNLFFRPGQIIPYWPYDGTAQIVGSRGDETNTQTIKGTSVTLVFDWSFYATVTFDSTITEGSKTIHKYNFKPMFLDADGCADLSGDNFTCHWQNYQACGSTSVFQNQFCFNIADQNGSSGAHLDDDTVVRVRRYYNNDEGSDLSYEYWFEPIGAGGGGTLQEVGITKDGGSAGDDSSECSWTYTFTWAGTTYNTVAMTGHGRRDPLGAMSPGTVGIISTAASGTPKLIFADEQNEMTTCTMGFDGGSA